ncbi:urea ABC transporter permease subunit UrtB [Methylobrevis pamukkalensis]|uniref:High-affinity branched-chain amino acid transport system permease protein LivH n=1 Tax=Methylobrevis pamukkalensis TaxID=1439726 RepID=A0A1E3H8Y2_9HYPH|nr:urea ABC transporter permease subunit UrtB [Methylobrevis pamukkalensis]ODN72256.1 High-affinity branched-chain amino acid transport system permease protein LivH [Methylobrevis pamukkalensis]
MSLARTSFTHIVVLVALVVAILAAGLGLARAQTDLKPLVDALGTGDFDSTEEAINGLAASGDPRVADILRALEGRELYLRKDDQTVVRSDGKGREPEIFDPLSGASLGTVKKPVLDRISVNNKIRRAVQAAVGTLTLRSPDADVRRSAALAVLKTREPATIPALDSAIAAETDEAIRTLMVGARGAAVLNSDAPDADKLTAIEEVQGLDARDAMQILTQYAGAPGEVGPAAQAAMDDVKFTLDAWSAAQNVWFGVSLGSVLLLAAIGLAITFGVMGVINMAHGEMVMIGAYVTFAVQELIRTSMPGLFDYSLLIALPLAFLVAGAMGVAIERGIIRFLYGRPLETLLATWGLSLILQQLIRSIFGAQNRQVGNPSWMSGSFDIGLMSITWSRLWIVVFAICVFFALMAVLKKTPFGLQTRAVTANRPMASAMGIRTPWIDAMTFGLGSGIAGIAGVALSQIENVSPNLGQGYIIDSFMVVVFGGVGNLWGTLVGALTLGVANKFLEPYAGAVLGKILVLVFIILFIQKRPRGLFALKGRAIEA